MHSFDSALMKSGITISSKHLESTGSIDFATALDAIGGGIIIIDNDLKILYTNNSALLMALTCNFIVRIGKRDLDLKFEQNIDNFIRRALKTGKNPTLLNSQTINGKVNYNEISVHKTDLGATITICNISERMISEMVYKESEQKMRKLAAFKDKLFSMITNDIKQPLSDFIDLTNALTKGFKTLSISEMSGMANRLNDSSTGLNKLFENLLDWAVIQNENIIFNPEYVLLKDMINNTLGLLSIIAQRKGITIENKIDSGLVLSVDLHLLNTVVRNVLTNALKFTRSGGKVRLYSTETPVYVNIIIVDNGIGMDAETLKSVFNISKRNPRLGTASEKGAGIGLIICKELMDGYGANLWFESKKNVGTRVIIRFPKIYRPM